MADLAKQVADHLLQLHPFQPRRHPQQIPLLASNGVSRGLAGSPEYICTLERRQGEGAWEEDNCCDIAGGCKQAKE